MPCPAAWVMNSSSSPYLSLTDLSLSAKTRLGYRSPCTFSGHTCRLHSALPESPKLHAHIPSDCLHCLRTSSLTRATVNEITVSINANRRAKHLGESVCGTKTNYKRNLWRA
jgi:hypothetical protein